MNNNNWDEKIKETQWQLKKLEIELLEQEVRQKRLNNDHQETMNAIEVQKAKTDYEYNLKIQGFSVEKEHLELGKLVHQNNRYYLAVKAIAIITAVFSFFLNLLDGIITKIKSFMGI